jgi:hypothetical protein
MSVPMVVSVLMLTIVLMKNILVLSECFYGECSGQGLLGFYVVWFAAIWKAQLHLLLPRGERSNKGFVGWMTI